MDFTFHLHVIAWLVGYTAVARCSHEWNGKWLFYFCLDIHLLTRTLYPLVSVKTVLFYMHWLRDLCLKFSLDNCLSCKHCIQSTKQFFGCFRPNSSKIFCAMSSFVLLTFLGILSLVSHEIPANFIFLICVHFEKWSFVEQCYVYTWTRTWMMLRLHQGVFISLKCFSMMLQKPCWRFNWATSSAQLGHSCNCHLTFER